MNIIHQIIGFWKDTWKNNKLLFFLETVGTITSIIAAVLISFWAPTPSLLLVFICYTIGSVSFVISSYIRKSAWMLLLMVFYTFTNVVGIFNVLTG